MASSATNGLRVKLPNVSSIEQLYEASKPTPRKVIKLFQCNPVSKGEEQALGFLKQYVRGLGETSLRKFLRHSTGAAMLCVSAIFIEFNMSKGKGRAPIAHTCGQTIVLPATYLRYNELRAEFNNILESGYFFMDIV